jgi:hypothetical protein
MYMYIQEESPIFCEVIVPAILSKKGIYVHVSYSEWFPGWSSVTVQTSNTP